MKNKDKKILIGVSVDGKGGVDAYILSFVKVANKAGYLCDVLTTKWSDMYAKKLNKSNANLVKIANLHDKNSIKITIDELHKKNNYSAAYWNISTCIMYPYVKESRDCGIKNICVHSHAHYNSQPNTIKTFIFDRLHYYYRRKMNKLKIKYAACSTDCARWIAGEDIVNKKQWTFVPNPIEVEKCTFNDDVRKSYRKKFNIEDKFVVGCATAFMPYKNPLFLIDVFSQILKQNNNAYLLLAGTGPMEQDVKEHAKESLPAGSYKLLGHRCDVPNLLQALDCFVLPSTNEGLPLCMLEAQAADLPCLTSTTITDEVIVLKDKFAQCNFSSGAKTWAKTILELAQKHPNRSTAAAQKISSAGFNQDSPSKVLPLLA